MKTIEQTRRELFEAAYLKRYFYPAERWSLVPETYRTQHAEIAWWSWCAALDAVVIELPDSHCEAQDSYMLSCEKAIESTNLGLKII